MKKVVRLDEKKLRKLIREMVWQMEPKTKIYLEKLRAVPPHVVEMITDLQQSYWDAEREFERVPLYGDIDKELLDNPLHSIMSRSF